MPTVQSTSVPSSSPSPLKAAVIIFAAAKILSVHTFPALVGAAAVAYGGDAVFRHLQEFAQRPIRNTYGRTKELLQQRLSATSRRFREASARAGVKIRAAVIKGVLIIWVWIAFAGEVAEQFVETFKLSVEVWQKGDLVFAKFAEATI